MSVRRARALVALVLLVVVATAACGEQLGREPRPSVEVKEKDSKVRLVDEEDADLVLYVSNQSFEDSTVRIEVVVDDVTVVDDDFAVEGQHTWIKFPLAVGKGRHRLTARTDSGAFLRRSFEAPGEPRYAVLDHWGKGDGAELSWLFGSEPFYFD